MLPPRIGATTSFSWWIGATITFMMFLASATLQSLCLCIACLLLFQRVFSFDLRLPIKSSRELVEKDCSDSPQLQKDKQRLLLRLSAVLSTRFRHLRRPKKICLDHFASKPDVYTALLLKKQNRHKVFVVGVLDPRSHAWRNSQEDVLLLTLSGRKRDDFICFVVSQLPIAFDSLQTMELIVPDAPRLGGYRPTGDGGQPDESQTIGAKKMSRTSFRCLLTV